VWATIVTLSFRIGKVHHIILNRKDIFDATVVPLGPHMPASIAID